MTARIAAAALVTIAGVCTIALHKKPPTAAPSAATVTPIPLRASRGRERPSLPSVNAPDPGARRPTTRPKRRGRPAEGSGGRVYDITMYCATGSRNAAGRWPQLGDVAVLDRSIRFGTRVVIADNVYVVRDWIGHGSDFDIYGGSDAGCEQRALDFGRRRLRVVVAR